MLKYENMNLIICDWLVVFENWMLQCWSFLQERLVWC